MMLGSSPGRGIYRTNEKFSTLRKGCNRQSSNNMPFLLPKCRTEMKTVQCTQNVENCLSKADIILNARPPMSKCVSLNNAILMNLTFDNPLSTGMRNRTSETRFWYKSRTLSTSAGEGTATTQYTGINTVITQYVGRSRLMRSES